MRLKRLIAEALNESDMPIEEFIEHVENLKGEFFVGSLKNDKADVDDSNLPEELYADFVATFENFKEDGFSVEDLKAYSHFIRDRKPFESNGIEFADWVHKDYTDEEIEENFADDDGKYWLFLNLTIKPNEFDGDFEKLAKDLDDYVKMFKERYDIIKASVSPEQKKKVKKLTAKTIGTKKAIRELFKNGTVVDEKQEWNRSHGTFTSNHTSGGTYAIEYTNKGLTKKDIQQYDYLVMNSINILKPKGSIYSSITGAKKEDIEKKIKSGDFIVTKDIIKFEGLPYTDVFIGD